MLVAGLPKQRLEAGVCSGHTRANAAAPLLEFAAHNCDSVWFGQGDVVFFRRVVLEVVEFESAVFELFDEFPVLFTDRAGRPSSLVGVVGHMPVEGNTQPFGLLNGGASMALAETLGSVGAHLHAGPTRSVVGIDINGTHHRSATSGIVTGTATPLSLGRTIAVYEIVITDERDKRICTARLTCLLRDLA